jgi:hypothetical protein
MGIAEGLTFGFYTPGGVTSYGTSRSTCIGMTIFCFYTPGGVTSYGTLPMLAGL